MNGLLTSLYTDLLPIILQVISAILGLLLLRLTTVARERWGIEIEARHREALQSALMSGASAALSRRLSWDETMKAVLDYVRRSVPDALAALAPKPGVLEDLAAARLRESRMYEPMLDAETVISPA